MDDQSPDNISSQRAYRSLFLLIDDAIILIDQQYKIIQMNPIAEALLGIPQNTAVGQKLDDVLANQHDIVLSLEDLPASPIKLLRDGKTCYFTLSLKPLPDQQGYIVKFDDVTREQNALSRVNELLAAYTDYAHTVGHDVKSPLGVAIGYSNMLQSELEQGTEAHFFADEIFYTSMRIMHICNELLLLTELQHRDNVEMAPINLNSLLETVIRRFKKELDMQETTLSIANDMPIVKGNLPWVEEVLVNYLRHVIVDSSPSKVEIGTEKQDDNMLKIWVKHDGQALPSEQHDTLFESNLNLEEIRAEGFGLGLNVAKQLVERLQGTVGVSGGKMIYFTLPADS